MSAKKIKSLPEVKPLETEVNSNATPSFGGSPKKPTERSVSFKNAFKIETHRMINDDK